jgi:glutamate 5-kinase
VLVSSGAILSGLEALNRPRAATIQMKQAAAAVGQSRLMAAWTEALGKHRIQPAQILLTQEDLRHRGRYLNARNTVLELLRLGALPIINENDTVAVDEIRWGDNDTLAALVCNLIGADLLIILTDVDGLHDAHPNQGGKRVPLVVDVDVEAGPIAGGSEGGVGSGGMASKVQAAKAAARHGVATVVVGGARPGVLREVLAGADVGTLFVPSSARMSSRKHWIAYGARPAGRVIVDAGAHRAVAELGRSLLPAGVVDVIGTFELGDIVGLVTADGVEFARGLAAYPATDLRRLRGLQSADIEATLGYKVLDEVIHRDDLVLL